MNIKILRTISAVKDLLFKQCKVGIGNVDDKWFEDVFKGATCEIETFGFGEKADLRAIDVKHISRPGYLGVWYHVTGLMDFDVEIDIPGDIQCVQFTDSYCSMQTF